MRRLHVSRLRLRSLLRSRQIEEELQREIQLHLDELIAENLHAGMSASEARLAALRTMGNIPAIQEACRETRGWFRFERLMQDLRHAFRMLRKSPIVTAGVVVALAVGIGANTAIFTLMNALFWPDLHIRNPHTLLVLTRARGSTAETGFTFPQYRTLRHNTDVVELAAYSSANYPVTLNVGVNGDVDPANGQLVSGNYFSLLGVTPIRGRAITPEDDRVRNGHAVAMISDAYWKRRFGRDPAIVGRIIEVFEVPFVIIGVSPPGFAGVEIGSSPDLFLPLMMQPTAMPVVGDLIGVPTVNRPWLQILARLQKGADAESAASVLDPVYRQALPLLLRDRPPYSEERLAFAAAATGVSTIRARYSQPLVVLLAIAAVLLLITCANAAGLVVSRTMSRQSELAMRAALGATRSRIARQLFIESLILAVAGGGGGVLLAGWAAQALLLYISVGASGVSLDVSMNLRVLAFSVSITAIAVLLFGLAPALRAPVDLAPRLNKLKDATKTRGLLRAERLLVVAQVVLSVLLLFAAGLFDRSLQNLREQNSGIAGSELLLVRVEPTGSNQRTRPEVSQRLDRLYRELLQRVEALPGVFSATMSNVSPTKSDSGADGPIRLGSGEQIDVSFQAVYPRYFGTLDLRIVSGRDFNIGDLRPDSAPVCIVNEAFVRKAYPDQDPIGKPCVRQGSPLRFFEIVGIVADTRYTNARAEPQPVIYQPFLQAGTGRGQMILHVRVSGNAHEIAPIIRSEVSKLDPLVPQFAIHTLEEEMDATLVRERVIAALARVFSSVALFITCGGLYALLAFSGLQRTGEIGIRMALGARRIRVTWMLVREALALVLAGVAIGIPITLFTARMVSNQLSAILFGIPATDTRALAIPVTLLLATAAVAAYLPSRRAAQLDPLIALRNE